MQQHMMLYILQWLTVDIAFISEANIEQIPETPNALRTYLFIGHNILADEVRLITFVAIPKR